MAAATVSSYTIQQMGNRRVVIASLTAPANNDTWDTGLKSIDYVGINFPNGDLAAADAISYTKSAGTVTIKVVGTARNLAMFVIGI